MYNVIQSNHILLAKRPALDWVRSVWHRRGFCTFLVVSAILCVLSGCGGGTPGPSPAASVPATAEPSQAATALLTSTATGTLTSTGIMSATVEAVTDTKLLTATSSKDVITYTVKDGDMLSVIASQYGTTVEAIKDVNGLKNDTIYPRQILTIPQTIALPLVLSDTVTPTETTTLAEATQPSAEDGSNTERQSSWWPPPWITEDVETLAISIGLLATLLIVGLVLLALRRGRAARATPAQPASFVAPISAGLAGPPAAGTAYLETKIDATGATIYYPLAQNVISIGRDPSNSIVLDQRFADLDGVSRQHAQIVRTGAVFIAKDLGSANGIWINQRRSRENVLRDGATLGIGKTQFIFRLNQPGGTV